MGRKLKTISIDEEADEIAKNIVKTEGHGVLSNYLEECLMNFNANKEMTNPIFLKMAIDKLELELVDKHLKLNTMKERFEKLVEVHSDIEIKENIEVLQEAQVDPTIKRRKDNADKFKLWFTSKILDIVSDEEIENLVKEYQESPDGLYEFRFEKFINTKGFYFDSTTTIRRKNESK